MAAKSAVRAPSVYQFCGGSVKLAAGFKTTALARSGRFHSSQIAVYVCANSAPLAQLDRATDF